jgi:hypothetical protein
VSTLYRHIGRSSGNRFISRVALHPQGQTIVACHGVPSSCASSRPSTPNPPAGPQRRPHKTQLHPHQRRQRRAENDRRPAAVRPPPLTTGTAPRRARGIGSFRSRFERLTKFGKTRTTSSRPAGMPAKWPTSDRNGWQASTWNAWPASSESAVLCSRCSGRP